MEETFGTVVIVLVVVAGLFAAAAYVGSGKLYEGIGKGAFSLDEPDKPRGPQPGTAAYKAEAEAETRQMLEAKSALRVARGEAPLDVDAEYAALMEPPAGAAPDEALRDEVRQLVIASNERRGRRGEPPLDVEAEVDRQLRDLGA